MKSAKLVTPDNKRLARIANNTLTHIMAMRKYFGLAPMDTPFSYPLFGRGKGQAIDRKQVKEMRKAL